MRGVRTLTALRVGTRGSRLAVAQTQWVMQSLRELMPELELEAVVIKTAGDLNLDAPLAEMGGKGVFVKEIETALLNGEIDLAVHSMKDMPAEQPPGLHIGCVPKRMAPFDAFVSNKYRYLSELPKNSVIATGSARRKAQLLRYRADLNVAPIRGNIETRLQKLDAGQCDALILAQAGLVRLGMANRIRAVIGMNILLPAAGQGALAIETRVDDATTNAIVQKLHHPESAICVNTERAFMHALGGGCHIPAGALAEASWENIILYGSLMETCGHRGFVESVVSTEASSIVGAQKLARRILNQGGAAILAELTGQDGNAAE